jgi:HAE1 family hydrophobic/amphiphilic exporter-1
MTALAGKNAILVVEFARDLQREGLSVTEAAVEATSWRFRPILMTSFTFILGVMPLLFVRGAGAARPASGTMVFGGMLASILLFIPFVPVLYVITERLSEHLRKDKSPKPDTKMSTLTDLEGIENGNIHCQRPNIQSGRGPGNVASLGSA